MQSRSISVFLCLLLSCQLREQPVDKSTLLGNDYRLFQGTPLWEVAKAAQDDEAGQLASLVKNGRVNLNYQEPQGGKTVLMLAVANREYEACQALLRLGASPNTHDHYNGASAMHEAAQNLDVAFLKLLLAHGGNPSDVEVGPRRTGNTSRETPLMAAISANFPAAVELLVAAGANVKYENEFHTTAFSRAMVQERYRIALYLLQHGADPHKPLFTRLSRTGPQVVYLAQYLREQPQDRSKYEGLDELIAYVRAHQQASSN